MQNVSMSVIFIRTGNAAVGANMFNRRVLQKLGLVSWRALLLQFFSLFSGYFPGGPELAGTGTRISPFWILLEPRVKEVLATTGAIRRAKLQSECHHQQTNTRLLQAGWPSWRPTNSVKDAQLRVTKSSCRESSLLTLLWLILSAGWRWWSRGQW